MTSAPPLAEKKSNFFLGFLLLPKAKREALSAVYAYCRLIDDIVDEGLPKDEARRQLDFWREEIERLYQGTPTHAISRGLLKAVADYKIPKEPFLEMIRGCAMDLDGTRYETIADLESYMRGVASAVGIM
ncbi:MAG: squalene/phytoene synthase family protein, partial [Elusimicrobiota bacterium]